MTDISGPEVIIAETRTNMTVILPAQRRLTTSPEWEAYCLIDSSDPRDAEWAPEWEEVSRLLHQLPEKATRVSIVFERRG